MSGMETKLAEILNNRFVELFQIVLKKPLKPALCAQDQVPFVAPLFHASIGLTGDGIEGQLVVIADKKFLHETHPERRYGGVLDNSDYLDWVAEICNRTLAGSKAHIHALGFHLRLEQPQAKQSAPVPVPAESRELVQVLESEGFHAVLSLRIRTLEAKLQKPVEAVSGRMRFMGDSRTIELVKDGVRTASLHRLFGPGYALPEMLPPPAGVDDIDETWLVKIIVSSEPVRIQFKVYYTVPLAKDLYHFKHPGSKELPVRIYHDFIREFCNLTAGAIKVWLADLVTVMKTDDLVVNLPDQKPAMVEMPPLGKKDDEDVLFDTWQFKADVHHLLCATEIQVFDWAQVANIQPNVHPADDSGDEIEFL